MEQNTDIRNENDLATAYLRKPGEKVVQFWRSAPDRFLKLPAVLPKGYLFAPFKSELTRPIFLIKGSPKDYELNSLPRFDFNLEHSNYPPITKEMYLNQVSDIIEACKSEELKKCIAWRRHPLDTPDKHPLDAFIGLCETYPQAQVFLFHHTLSGCWLGASPEIILESSGNRLQTTSLAGTRKRGEIDTNPWTNKEKEEQAMVTDFIADILHKEGLEFSSRGPSNTEAGPVIHLETRFEIANHDPLAISNLLQSLHPTPAVGGLPRNEALEYIDKQEQDDRAYYTGFNGEVESPGKMQLYVNLRCARFYRQNADLYVGGGITAESEPESEYRETLAKAETLSAVIQKI